MIVLNDNRGCVPLISVSNTYKVFVPRRLLVNKKRLYFFHFLIHLIPERKPLLGPNSEQFRQYFEFIVFGSVIFVPCSALK